MRNPVIHVLVLLLIIGVSGCGSGGSSSRKSTAPEIIAVAGRVIQGPVDGGIVYADKNYNNILDDGEVWTETNREGLFVLGVPDNYGDYQLVSQGGTDTLTNKPALPMMAPARSSSGNTNITPITTIIALAPVAERESVKSKLEELIGTAFDVDHAAADGTAPEVLATVKAIEQTLTVVRDSFGVTSTADQFEVMKSIATEIAKDSVTFAGGTDDLKTVLPAAIMESPEVKEKVKSEHILSIRVILTSVTEDVVQKVIEATNDSGLVIEDQNLSIAVELERQAVIENSQSTINFAIKTVRLTLQPIRILTTDPNQTEIIESEGVVTVNAATVSEAILAVQAFNSTGESKSYTDEQLELVIRDLDSDRSARFRVTQVDVAVTNTSTISIDLSRARLDVTATNSQGNQISTKSVTNSNGDLDDLVVFEQVSKSVKFFMQNIQQKLGQRVADDFANITLQGNYMLTLTADQVPLVPRSVQVISN